MVRTPLNRRAIVTFFMLFSFATLPLSGVLLHESVLHGTEHLKFLSMAFHNVAAIVFTLSAVVHVKYNWRSIVRYLLDNRHRLARYSREVAIAGSTLVILLLFSLMHVMHSHW